MRLRTWASVLAAVLVLWSLPACTATAAPSPAPAAHAPAATPLRSMSALGMVTVRTGWALSSGQVLRTVDGGRQWTDMSPQTLRGRAGNISAAWLTAFRAWIAVSHGTANRHIAVWRTADGGARWTGSLVPVPAGSFPIQLQFTNPQDGWLMVEYQGTAGLPVVGGELLATTDGGLHWAVRASRLAGTLPWAGSIRFVGHIGWLTGQASGLAGNVIYETTDSGRRWIRHTLPVPGGSPTSILVGPPWWTSPSDGLLTAFDQSTQQTIVYRTDSAGRTWQGVRVDANMGGSIAPDGVAYVLGTSRLYWLTMRSDAVSSVPLPPAARKDVVGARGAVPGVDFLAKGCGWIYAWAGDGVMHMYFTTDQGRSWSAWTPQIAK